MENINIKNLFNSPNASSTQIVSENELQKLVDVLTSKITELENNPADSRPYKVYTALLTQSDLADPVATVLENTLDGTPVWTREDVGVYKATLTSAFVQNKTYITIGTSAEGVDDTQVSSSGKYSDADTIKIFVNDLDRVGYDGYLYGAPIEIRVYN